MSSTRQPPLLTLPTELLLSVYGFLDYNSIQSLRASCHALIITLPRPTKAQRTALKLPSGAGQYSCREMAFSCAACFKMLPWTRFSTRLRKLKKDSLGRFCIECGMRDWTGNAHENCLRYQKGEKWRVDGSVMEIPKDFLRCLDCGKVDSFPGCKESKVCWDCFSASQMRILVSLGKELPRWAEEEVVRRRQRDEDEEWRRRVAGELPFLGG